MSVFGTPAFSTQKQSSISLNTIKQKFSIQENKEKLQKQFYLITENAVTPKKVN